MFSLLLARYFSQLKQKPKPVEPISFRVNEQPVKIFLACGDIQISFQRTYEQSLKLAMSRSENKASIFGNQTYDLINGIEKLELKFSKVVPERDQEIFQYFDDLILKAIQNKRYEPLSEEEWEKLKVFSLSLLEFTEQNEKLSYSHLVLYEILNIVRSNEEIRLEEIREFIKLIEIDETLQPHLFSQQQILQQIHPCIENSVSELSKFLQQNLSKYTMLANIAGASYRYKTELPSGGKLEYSEHVPVSLTPYEVDKNKFLRVRAKQQLWNRLLNEMSLDREWIEEIFQGMSDDFLQNHLKIWKNTRDLPFNNKTNVCVVRNDMMFDCIDDEWKQIEFNTIAVSFAHISDCVQDFHEILLNSDLRGRFKNFERLKYQNQFLIVEAIEKSVQIYAQTDSIVVMVVAEFEGNSYDQRFVEYELNRRGIRVRRLTFEQIQQNLKVDQQNGKLLVGGEEVALVYYRTGYGTDHYPNESIWRVREQIESSRAFKLPNIQLSLINFKKAQQALQRKGCLERFLGKFLKTEEEVNNAKALIEENFAKIYDFDDESVQPDLLKLTLEHPQDYVLKPQREGGSNNYYGKAIYQLLNSLNTQERKNYILMEKVKSQPRPGFMVRGNNLQVHAVIAEVGFLSYFISQGPNLIHNVDGGYLCRTKKFLEDEGGVATGYAVIDSLISRIN